MKYRNNLFASAVRMAGCLGIAALGALSPVVAQSTPPAKPPSAKAANAVKNSSLGQTQDSATVHLSNSLATPLPAGPDSVSAAATVAPQQTSPALIPATSGTPDAGKMVLLSSGSGATAEVTQAGASTTMPATVTISGKPYGLSLEHGGRGI